MKRPTLLLMLVILASIFLFFLLNLLLGSVHIPFRSVWNILWGNTDESIIWQNIIWKSRVPQALTALVAGAGLSVSGLQMQTVFKNRSQQSLKCIIEYKQSHFLRLQNQESAACRHISVWVFAPASYVLSAESFH